LNKYKIINIISIILFFLIIINIYLFKNFIKPLNKVKDEISFPIINESKMIIYDYEKKIDEYLKLLKTRMSVDKLEKRTIKTNKSFKNYFLLSEDDTYELLINQVNGTILKYSKKNEDIEILNKQNWPFVLIGDSRNAFLLRYKNIYFNPYNSEYDRSFFIKEKNNENIVISQICIGYTLWDRADKKLYPSAMSETLYMDIIKQLEEIGEINKIKDINLAYDYLDLNNIQPIDYQMLQNTLPFINLVNQKENFYYLRNTGSDGPFYNLNSIFEKLKYNEFDIRCIDKTFGYDGKSMPVCVVETTINIKLSTPTISYKIISISPEGVNYTLYNRRV
jgi:hypothetical protein